MQKSPAILLATAICLMLGGCAGPTQTISTDLTRVSGVYVIAYVDRQDVRTRLEQRFVAELAERDVRAIASQPDLPEIKQASPRDMVRAANLHDVAAIIIVNRIAGDGSGSIIRSDRRILPADLAAYYEVASTEPDDYANEDPVYAEANGFLVDGNRTRRFWTGTTWTFGADEDTVIDNVARTIAIELSKASQEMRDYSRPM